MKKLDKIILSVLTFIVTFSKKVFGSTIPDVPEPQPVYGVPMPPAMSLLQTILKVVLIPIVLVVGLIIYLFKSKASKLKKTITSIIIILLVCLIYWLIEIMG